MHTFRENMGHFLIVGVWFGVLLSLGQSGGMTRFVSGRLLFLFLFFFHYNHHHA